MPKKIGFNDSCEYVIPALNDLTYDQEVTLRTSITEILPALFILLKEKGRGKTEFILEKLLPIIVLLLKDKQEQVREGAINAYLEITKTFSKAEIEKHAFVLIDQLAKETEEDSRTSAAVLSNKISPIMGRDLTMSYSIQNMTKYVEDSTFAVRVVWINTVNSLFGVIGQKETESILLPVFCTLSTDFIWSVRKACAEQLAEFSKNISPKARSDSLVPLFVAFAEDDSRWVRTAAFNVLGPLIATFERTEIPEQLLRYFCELANDKVDTIFGDFDHVVFCAYNFPAVLYTIGEARWPEVRATYLKLSEDLQWKVRRTLSFSLHTIAEILGEKRSEEDLLPIFDKYLRDLDEVRVGVLKNLSKFLKVLSMDTRKKYLYILDEIQHSSVNWRFRKLITRQIGDLALSFDSETVFFEIVPFVHALLADPVASVRRAIHEELAKIIISLKSLPEKQKEFIQKIKELPKNTTYQNRLIFTKVCASSVPHLDKETFNGIFLNDLLEMHKDGVPNIRLCAAAALAEIQKNKNFCNDSRITKALNELKSDKDRDVVICAGGIPKRK